MRGSIEVAALDARREKIQNFDFEEFFLKKTLAFAKSAKFR